MLLPGKQDYVAITGFEVIFRGDRNPRPPALSEACETLATFRPRVVDNSGGVCELNTRTHMFRIRQGVRKRVCVLLQHH